MDDEALILEIDIQNDDAANKAMSDLAKTVKTIQQPLDSASDSVAKLEKNLRAAGGPADKLYKAMLQLRNANMYGDPADQFDAQHKWMKAQRAYGNAQKAMQPQGAPSFADKLKNVLYSSRFGAGGIMPLVGKTLDLLGAEAVGAAAGVKLLWDAANDAAQSLTEFRAAMNTSGGSASEVAKLNATGLSDPAGLSRALSDALKDGGAGTAAGSRVGIHDYGNALSGPVDKAENLIRALSTIGDRNVIKDDHEAIRLARALHIEQVLMWRDVSDATKDAARQAAAASAAVNNPDAVKSAAEFNAQMGIAGMWFDTLKTDIGSSFLPQASGAVELFGDIAHGLHNIYSIAKPLIDITNYISPLGLYKLLHGVAEQADASLNHADATRENTEALNKNTAAALKEGTYGGGQRARNAIPSAWGGSNVRTWDGQARSLGSML